MNLNSLLKGANIIKIVSSLNKTLNVINKAIPMYEQIKPLINNFGGIFDIISKINSVDKKDENPDNKNLEIITNKKKVSNYNLPTFFQ